MEPLDPQAALLYRKAQLLAQEQAAMQGPTTNLGLPSTPVQPPAMTQAQFSGYGQPTPQQQAARALQLQALLRNR